MCRFYNLPKAIHSTAQTPKVLSRLFWNHLPFNHSIRTKVLRHFPYKLCTPGNVIKLVETVYFQKYHCHKKQKGPDFTFRNMFRKCAMVFLRSFLLCFDQDYWEKINLNLTKWHELYLELVKTIFIHTR